MEWRTWPEKFASDSANGREASPSSTFTLNLDIQEQKCLMELPDRGLRRAVVRCPGYAQPLLMELPDLRMRTASHEEIRARHEMSREWLRQIYRPLHSSPSTAATLRDDGAAPVAEERPIPISKAKLDYTIWCMEGPFAPVTVRDRNHGISAGMGNAYRQELAERGLLKLHQIQTGRRGGQLRLTEVTDKAYRVLERFRVPIQRPPGRGSFEHKFWQHTVREFATRNGCSSKIEEEVAGKAVDVGIKKEGRRIAVEIVMEGIEKELSNVEKDLRAGWDQIVVCAVRQETLDQVREKMMDKLGDELIRRDKVRFCRLSRFLHPPDETADAEWLLK